jgi:prepilin-type processing-associated H-X9-DG protein
VRHLTRVAKRSASNRRVTTAVLLLLISCWLLPAHAAIQPTAPLADRIPGDALFYVGWAGTDALRQSYDASHLKEFLASSNLPVLAEQYLPVLWDKLIEKSTEPWRVTAVRGVLATMCRHPVALYFRVPIDDPTLANKRIALICDAGDDREVLADQLRDFAKQFNLTDVQISTRDSAVVMSNDHDVHGALSDDADFKAAVSPLQPSAAFVLYISGAGILSRLDASLATDPHVRDYLRVRDALGIGDFRSYAMTAGFDGADWMTASFLSAPAPRNGLLAAIEPHPVDRALLSRVPESSNVVSMVNFDVAKLLETIDTSVAAGGGSEPYERAWRMSSTLLGRDLRRQVLAPLGPQWVLYSTVGQPGAVMLNAPRDAQTASDALPGAVRAGVNLMNVQMSKGANGAAVAHAPPFATIGQQEANGVQVTTVSAGQLSPSFTVKDGILYVGANAQMVIAAATADANDGAAVDFLHRDSFVAARQRLGAPPTIGDFEFYDLPKTAPLAYNMVGVMLGAARSAAAINKLDLPDITLPTLAQVTPMLSPALSASWADDRGIYSKSVSPFPGSTFVAGDPPRALISVGGAAMVVSIMLPAFNRARETANRVQCASNERQICIASLNYSRSHQSKLPPDLGTLIAQDYVHGVEIFVCPSSSSSIPLDVRHGTKQQQAAWVNQHSDYVLQGAGQDLPAAVRSATPLVAEREGDHSVDGLNIGFADGHIAFFPMAEAKRIIGTTGEHGL